MVFRQVFKILLVTSSVWFWVAISANADEVSSQQVQDKTAMPAATRNGNAKVLRDSRIIRKIPQLKEVEHPSTNARMLVQSPATNSTPVTQVIPITGVKANPTPQGVEVILETPIGTQLQVTNRSMGNNFIVDVSGGQLRLANGNAFTFRSEKPVEGITEITATNIDAKTVRVTVVGVAALPTVELFDDDAGLVFAIASTGTATSPPQPPQTPQASQPLNQTQPTQPSTSDEPIELVVTGEQDRYTVPDASTATKTDTPLRDIPQSIQVVPQQVLRDRNVRTVTESVETVSGIVDAGNYLGSPAGGRIIRGFEQAGNYLNGYRDSSYYALTGVGTIEQVEVLKGPASVLFGAVEPGGIVNIVTKQPLSDPYFNLAFEVGNREFYQPSIDISGPFNTDKTLLYRFNASTQSSNGFQDFVKTNLTTIAPSITWKLGDRTDLNLYYEYIRFEGDPPEQATTLFSDGSFLPRSLFPGYPQLNFTDITTQKYGYTLNHKFSDNWQIRNNLAVASTIDKEQYTGYTGQLVDDRFLVGIRGADRAYTIDNYFAQLDLLGKFQTGSISHQLLIGFDFNKYEQTFTANFANLPTLDIFNPNYNIPEPKYTFGFDSPRTTDSYGIYLQDQITVFETLKLLIGGRGDWVSDKNNTQEQNDSALSPRIGLVYQPSKSISLYTSYSQSFVPSQGFNPNREAFKPTKGTQYDNTFANLRGFNARRNRMNTS